MKTAIPLCIVLCFALTTFGQEKKKSENAQTTEVFRVSNVGAKGAVESRELLKDLYEEIEVEHNAEVERERREQKINFAGNRVLILKLLEETEGGNRLYLTAYNGQPSVFAIANGAFKPGDKTPPLKIQKNGIHETTVTREIVEKKTSSGVAPSLEKAGKGGGVTFFGIPIDTGGGGSAAPQPEPEEEVTEIRRLVTEVKTMPKFAATVSEEVSKEGPPLFSQKLFLESVKNGTVYSINRTEDRRCQTCRGFRRITAIPGQTTEKSRDGKMSCPECKEVGSVKWDVIYKVTW